MLATRCIHSTWELGERQVWLNACELRGRRSWARARHKWSTSSAAEQSSSNRTRLGNPLPCSRSTLPLQRPTQLLMGDTVRSSARSAFGRRRFISRSPRGYFTTTEAAYQGATNERRAWDSLFLSASTCPSLRSMREPSGALADEGRHGARAPAASRRQAAGALTRCPPCWSPAASRAARTAPDLFCKRRNQSNAQVEGQLCGATQRDSARSGPPSRRVPRPPPGEGDEEKRAHR